jgi:hypothetical protein
MNIKILLFVFGTSLIGACSSAYKTGQTPDDVYYSPARQTEEYVEREDRNDRYQPDRYVQYDDYVNDIRNDRFLRLSLRNRLYMNTYDDFFWNDWRFGLANNWYNPWNNYFAWNSFYNPYCFAPVYNGKTFMRNPVMFRPSVNAITYTTPTMPRTSPRYNFTRSSYSNGFLNTSPRSSNFRKIVSGLESGSNSGSSRPDRTISNSSSSGSSSRSSSSGSSSSGGSVSRPGRN